MDNKRVLALRKQLKREQLHVVWLEQHLPNSRQLNSAQQRIAQLCVSGSVLRVQPCQQPMPQQKRATPKRRSLFNRSRFRLECEVQTNSCQVISCIGFVVHCCESRCAATECVINNDCSRVCFVKCERCNHSASGVFN